MISGNESAHVLAIKNDETDIFQDFSISETLTNFLGKTALTKFSLFFILPKSIEPSIMPRLFLIFVWGDWGAGCY